MSENKEDMDLAATGDRVIKLVIEKELVSLFVKKEIVDHIRKNAGLLGITTEDLVLKVLSQYVESDKTIRHKIYGGEEDVAVKLQKRDDMMKKRSTRIQLIKEEIDRWGYYILSTEKKEGFKCCYTVGLNLRLEPDPNLCCFTNDYRHAVDVMGIFLEYMRKYKYTDKYRSLKRGESMVVESENDYRIYPDVKSKFIVENVETKNFNDLSNLYGVHINKRSYWSNSDDDLKNMIIFNIITSDKNNRLPGETGYDTSRKYISFTGL